MHITSTYCIHDLVHVAQAQRLPLTCHYAPSNTKETYTLGIQHIPTIHTMLGIILWISTFIYVAHGTRYSQIPSIMTFTESTPTSSFVMTSNLRIIVDTRFQHAGSPSLLEFSRTFRTDLVSMTGLDVPNVSIGSMPLSNLTVEPFIFLTLGAPPTKHKLFNGKQTNEGYDFEISRSSYIIKGVEPIGAWWGTRTLLQQIALSPNVRHPYIPTGFGSDTPGWEVRGVMLDVGRHWFTTGFLGILLAFLLSPPLIPGCG